VEQSRYRFRYLNGCDSRFLILKHDQPLTFWQIGASQGYLSEVVEQNELLLGPAERADVIVDFGDLPVGTEVTLINIAPDEPYGGGVPGEDFDVSDPGTTGQVMKFKVVATRGRDRSTPPQNLVLPALQVLPPAQATRKISLNELESETMLVSEDSEGNIVLDMSGDPFGPTEALLGILDADGNGVPLGWGDATTENPEVGATEIWEIYNFTADAHPIHIHLVQFQVVDRQALATDANGDTVQPAELVAGTERAPEASETGFKDTVISYPGEITRVKAQFDLEGLFVWHCHILEHEDNEMMRPYCVGNSAACEQHNNPDGGGH
jgi:FtsP/CotA-like multicopper oxidase with cupredoxin domain